jgi:hypothetical protein
MVRGSHRPYNREFEDWHNKPDKELQETNVSTGAFY